MGDVWRIKFYRRLLPGMKGRVGWAGIQVMGHTDTKKKFWEHCDMLSLPPSQRDSVLLRASVSPFVSGSNNVVGSSGVGGLHVRGGCSW